MMDNLLILAAAVAALVIIFSLFKKTPNLGQKIRNRKEKEDFYRQDQQHFVKEDQVRDHKEVEQNKKKDIRPEGNQQRDLNRETGGLEESGKGAFATHNPWDNRSDEIDQEGSIDQLGSTGKKSMLWRKKKEKMDIKEELKDMTKEELAELKKGQGSGANFDSRYQNQAGFGQMIRSRQDSGGDRGGGISL